jgi:regulator of protease activity HflC (stomatin/prohibitin superfamily)
MRRINEAEGQGQAIERVAQATANSIREIANAINEKSGMDAVNLNIAQRYIDAFAQLAQKNNTMIIPSNLSDVAGVVSSLGKIFTNINKNEK